MLLKTICTAAQTKQKLNRISIFYIKTSVVEYLNTICI